MNKSQNKTNSALGSGSLRQIFTTPVIVCLVIYAVISLALSLVYFSYYESVSTLFYDLRNEANSTSPFYIIYTNYEDVYIGMILGFLLGFFQFRFLSDKNACYTKLSFGIKRKALFYNNAFYPLVCAVFIVFFTKLIAVIANIYYLGLHINIIKMFILSVLATILPIIFTFTVTVIANVLTTRKIETILLTGSVIAIPFALFSIISNIFSITLFGYGKDTYSYNEITNILSKINPAEMLYDMGEFDYFSYGIIEKTSFGGEILWCIICIVACFGALLWTAFFFEKRFKPENCGKKGVSKLSLILISFTASSLLSAAIIESTNPGYLYIVLEDETRIILALVAGSLAAIIINLLVMLGKKKVKQGLLGAGISVGVHVIVILIGLTGCFGFTTKVPDTEDISEISISVPFEDLNTNSFNHYFDEIYAFSSIYVTDTEDFEIIKNIHKSAVKTKDINETFIECYIEYTLKNGDTITRYYYDLSEETVNEYMKLWETKAVKDLYKVQLNQGTPEEPDEDSEEFNGIAFEGRVISPTDYLIIASKDLTFTDLSHPTAEQTHKVPTEEIKLEIMAALYKDICNLSAEDWFKPEKQYGALIFDCASRSYDETTSIAFEDAYSEVNSVFYINSNMVNTITILKKYGYDKYFECTQEVEKAHLITAENLAQWVQSYSFNDITPSYKSVYDAPVKHNSYYTVNNFYREDYLIYGCEYVKELYTKDYKGDYTDQIPAEFYDDYDEHLPIESPPIKEITNPSEIQRMIENGFMSYNIGSKGSFIVVRFVSGNCTILAIPE